MRRSPQTDPNPKRRRLSPIATATQPALHLSGDGVGSSTGFSRWPMADRRATHGSRGLDRHTLAGRSVPSRLAGGVREAQ